MKIKQMLTLAVQWYNLVFEHSPSHPSEIEHFEIFSHPQENKLAQRFFVIVHLLFFFLIA